MDPLDRLGQHLASTSTRRRFLRRAGRFVAAIGSGLVVVTSTSANSNRAAAFNECPCNPEQGHWCSGCPASDPNTNGGCPPGYSYYYGWWCCINGVGVKCSDCNLNGYLCTCSINTIISC
jgi:hypothetical protein